MNKISCLIADDEQLAVNIIESHLAKLPNYLVTGTCSNGTQVYRFLKEHPVNLLFLDIQMPELTGLELLRTLKNPPSVVLTTAYREFALEGFEFNVVDYLLKPIPFDRFLIAISKFEHIGSAKPIADNSLPQPLRNFDQHFIYVKSDKKMVRVMVRDIQYIEGLKGFIKIHTADRDIITYQTLYDLEETLSPDHFIRIHRSFIVSLNYVTAFSASHVEIGTKELPIGGAFAEVLQKKLRS
jgi:DNA-binding LytR/AlgR family response regulator